MDTATVNSPIPYRKTTLAGWGQFRKGDTWLAKPEQEEQLQTLLKRREYGSLLPIGTQRSYGDSCINTDRGGVSLEWLDRAVAFDPQKGTFAAEAGITLEEMIRIILPHGWFLPVTPGTQYPSLGGCIAADVHGKNHHQAGAIGRHVTWFDLLPADGSVKRCSEKRNKQLFSATLGGMGLTGIILRAELQLQKVSSGFIHEKIIQADSLRELMEALSVHDTQWPYTVSWVDCAAGGPRLGRGLVMLGRHAEIDELPRVLRLKALETPDRTTLEVPFTFPLSAVNPMTTRLFNTTYREWFGRHRESTSLKPYVQYFYPLDIARKWYRLYGRPGFVQYQFVVPMEAGETVFRRVLSQSLKAGHPSSLAVLKRFGKGEGLLSFPMEGWSLALDIPVRPGLLRLLDELDRVVLDHGGRIYLAKDARMKASVFDKMYQPELSAWRSIKQKYDPDNMFSSDQARRLKIVEEAG